MKDMDYIEGDGLLRGRRDVWEENLLVEWEEKSMFEGRICKMNERKKMLFEMKIY